MTLIEIVQSVKDAAATIEAVWQDNVRLRTILNHINDRDDATNELRSFILQALTDKKGLH